MKLLFTVIFLATTAFGFMNKLKTELQHASKILGTPTHLDFLCLAQHCKLAMAEAITDPNFYKLSACEEGCNPFFTNDTTDMKLHYQNCTTKCALTYEGPKVQKFMTCAMDHECMSFEPIGNTTCPVPDVDPESSLQSLSGEWW